jgi:hypothetical protein
MRKPLRKAASGSFGPQKGCILKLGEKGDSSFVDGGRTKQTPVLVGSLGGVMHRLRTRRAVRDEAAQNQAPWDRAHVGLDMMPISEKLFNKGGSSDAADYGGRLVGVLGDAEHYGSFP